MIRRRLKCKEDGSPFFVHHRYRYSSSSYNHFYSNYNSSNLSCDIFYTHSFALSLLMEKSNDDSIVRCIRLFVSSYIFKLSYVSVILNSELISISRKYIWLCWFMLLVSLFRNWKLFEKLCIVLYKHPELKIYWFCFV